MSTIRDVSDRIWSQSRRAGIGWYSANASDVIYAVLVSPDRTTNAAVDAVVEGDG